MCLTHSFYGKQYSHLQPFLMALHVLIGEGTFSAWVVG